MLPPAPSHVALTPAHPPAPPPAPETGVNNAVGRSLGCVGSPVGRPLRLLLPRRPGAGGRRWCHQREGQWAGELRELPNPWQRLDPFWTGTGVTGHRRVGRGWGRPGQAGATESAPGLGSSPFRLLLSLVRTGPSPVPTARPPSSAPQGLGKDVGKQERARDSETQRC